MFFFSFLDAEEKEKDEGFEGGGLATARKGRVNGEPPLPKFVEASGKGVRPDGNEPDEDGGLQSGWIYLFDGNGNGIE